MSKTFIFGSNGFVGQSISRCLEANNYETVKIDRKSFSKFIEKPDIFHNTVKEEDKLVFASAIVPAKTVPLLIENLALVQAFVEICSELKFAYILNVSSDAVYGDYSRPISEGDAPMPSTIHGLMHYSRELILSQNFSGRLGNLRPTLIFGPSDPHNGYGPNKFMRRAMSGKPIQVIGQGEERRDHIFIKDVAEIAFQMVRQNITGEVNAATGDLWSFDDIAKIVESKVPGSKIEYLPRGTGPLPHNGYRGFDTNKLKSLFPKLYITCLEEGLATFLEAGV